MNSPSRDRLADLVDDLVRLLANARPELQRHLRGCLLRPGDWREELRGPASLVDLAGHLAVDEAEVLRRLHERRIDDRVRDWRGRQVPIPFPRFGIFQRSRVPLGYRTTRKHFLTHASLTQTG